MCDWADIIFLTSRHTCSCQLITAFGECNVQLNPKCELCMMGLEKIGRGYIHTYTHTETIYRGKKHSERHHSGPITAMFDDQFHGRAAAPLHHPTTSMDGQFSTSLPSLLFITKSILPCAATLTHHSNNRKEVREVWARPQQPQPRSHLSGGGGATAACKVFKEGDLLRPS